MPKAHALAPRPVRQTLAVAEKHLQAGRFSAASAACRDILRNSPDWPPALHLLGVVAFKSGDVEGGFKFLRRALAGEPANAQFHGNLGLGYRLVGQLDAARGAFEKAIEHDPRDTEHYFNLGEISRFASDDPHLAAMEQLAREMASLPLASQTRLNFALAKAYDDLGRCDDAFRHLLRGNTLKRSQVHYDEAAMFAWLERIRTAFSPALLERKREAGFVSSLPVFVVGMPRSGTTLVEQILASHPAVHGAGELDDIGQEAERLRAAEGGRALRYPECVPHMSGERLRGFGRTYALGLRRRAPRALRVTDKAVSQVRYLGLIHLALPEARVIYVKRNPLDTCFSCYATLFGEGQNFTYDQGELARYYRMFAEMMAYWRQVLPPERFIEVEYEAVIAGLESEARRLIAFCGLDWDPRCLDFHKTQRPVNTASAAQVRQPIYQSSRGRAEAYRKHLGPLIAALGDLA
jgi:tetratricopeptide (TPR) repeat protein